jgi:D-alanyl-D-alanine-carboxypeptidase/D-alanyl-D-alanine-endopeptidase
MRKLLLLLLLIPSLTFSQGIDNEVKKIAKDYLKKKPGALIIGIRRGGQNKIYYFGEVKRGTHQLPDNNSLFELGELTEVFTAAIYSELAFDHVVSADDPLQKYLPEGVQSPQYAKIICEPVDKDVSFDKDNGIHISPYACRPDTSYSPQPVMLCYLANHTSGLPELPDNINVKSNDPLANYSAEDLYSFLKHYQFVNRLVFDYRHSTLGIGILGHVMELKTGKKYNELLKEKISGPLGLTSCYIYKPEEDDRLLNGYTSKGSAAVHQHFGVLSGGKGVSANITDLMKVLEANMPTEKSHLADLFAFNQKTRIKSGGKEFALGWQIKKHNDKPVIFQQGKTTGFASYMGFLREDRAGVVILSSIAKDTDKAGTEILNLLMNQDHK